MVLGAPLVGGVKRAASQLGLLGVGGYRVDGTGSLQATRRSNPNDWDKSQDSLPPTTPVN